jgi:POT family proton-dependent oligopeptide transporter
VLPAQIQVVNGLFILGMVPIFSFGIYPLMGKFFKVTPLRKISIGLFLVSCSFLIVSRIESQIQSGHVVSVWWQILAYLVLTASEVLVSITALEFSYKQAPLRMKSFIMALFLFSTSVGNMMTAAVNGAMVRPLHAVSAQTGASGTWIKLDDTSNFVTGQKIDLSGETGVTVTKADGKKEPLSGTFLVEENDVSQNRVKLMDSVERRSIVTSGAFDAAKAKVATYRLVGPQYFNFFAMVMAGVGVLFIFVAAMYKEKTHLRTEAQA